MIVASAPHPKRFSALPACLAALATALLLLPFTLQLTTVQTDKRAEPFVLYLLPAQAAPPARAVAQGQVVSSQPVTRRRIEPSVVQPTTLNPLRSAAPHESVPESSEPSSQAQAQVAAPEPPASVPLRLDLKALREASRASKSEARLMAEASGAYFGDAPVSKQEQFADAVAKTAKPPCVGPGGSLLSIFVIAYKVAKDECR